VSFGYRQDTDNSLAIERYTEFCSGKDDYPIMQDDQDEINACVSCLEGETNHFPSLTAAQRDELLSPIAAALHRTQKGRDDHEPI